MTSWILFWTYFRTVLFTLGGGYAILPVLQRAVVLERKWLSEESFLEIVTIAQSLPGALAVNCSILSGYRIRGVRGALAAALGSVLPSFLVIVLVGAYLYRYADHPVAERFFSGVRPAVVALIMYYGITMLRKVWGSPGRLILVGAFLAVYVMLRPSPIVLILASVFFGFFFAGRRGRGGETGP